MARIQAIEATKPVVMDSRGDRFEWGPLKVADEHTFADAEYPQPEDGERLFYCVAVQVGVSCTDVATIAVLGVTRDLELGIEERFRVDVSGGEIDLVGRDGIPAAFCAPEPDPEDAALTDAGRDRYGAVLEQAHGLEAVVGGDA